MPETEDKGLVISLEGNINGQPEGTLFNLEQWKVR